MWITGKFPKNMSNPHMNKYVDNILLISTYKQVIFKYVLVYISPTGFNYVCPQMIRFPNVLSALLKYWLNGDPSAFRWKSCHGRA